MGTVYRERGEIEQAKESVMRAEQIEEFVFSGLPHKLAGLRWRTRAGFVNYGSHDRNLALITG